VLDRATGLNLASVDSPFKNVDICGDKLNALVCKFGGITPGTGFVL
jgi:hypothetical protein